MQTEILVVSGLSRFFFSLFIPPPPLRACTSFLSGSSPLTAYDVEGALLFTRVPNSGEAGSTFA